MTPFKLFFQSFYTMFLAWFLLANIVMFTTTITGAPPVGVPSLGGHLWDFNNYYFGFESFLNFVRDLSNNYFLSLYTDAFGDFINAVLLRAIPNDFAGEVNILNALFFIVNLITAPVIITLYLFRLLALTLGLILEFVYMFYRLLGGYYNLPIADTYNAVNIFGVFRYMVCC